MRWGFLCLGLVACTAEDTDTDAVDTDTVDTDTDAVDTDTDDGLITGTFTGIVTDEAGSPVVGAAVNFCRLVCVTAETGTDGRYTLQAAAETGSFYVREESDLLDVIVTLTLPPDQTVTVDVPLRDADQSVAIPTVAAAVEVAPGLTVTASADTIEPPAFEELGDTLSGALVPADARLPLEISGQAGEPLAVWYLAPFEATAEPALPFEVANTFGLAAGAQVQAWAASGPDRFTWLDAGVLTVSEDGQRITGGALPIFSTLAIYPVSEQ